MFLFFIHYAIYLISALSLTPAVCSMLHFYLAFSMRASSHGHLSVLSPILWNKVSHGEVELQRWWLVLCGVGVRASPTVLFIALQSHSLLSAPSRREWIERESGVCGRVWSAINAGCQKEKAGVYTMLLNHWAKHFSFSPFPLLQGILPEEEKAPGGSECCE